MKAGKSDVLVATKVRTSSVATRKRILDAPPVRDRLKGSVAEALPDDALEPALTAEAPPTHVPERDPIGWCARLWSLCTGRDFDPDLTPASAEFLAFLAMKGLDTPRITPLFDVEYYAEQISWQLEPKNYILHYCESALDAAVQPHVMFDGDYILSQAGLKAFDRPPLLYFLEENDPSLSPHPLFEPDLYAAAVGDEFLAGDLPVVAFIDRWARKPAPFSSYFCHSYYCLHEPVVRYSWLNPLIHFLSMAPDRRRDPNPMFHRGWYASNLPEHEDEKIEPLVHYIRYGLPLGTMPNPFAYEELRASSLGLPALVATLRRYLSFPTELSAT